MKLNFYNPIFPSLLLLFIGVVLYFPILDNWYSEFAGDDDWMVYENRYVFSLSLENIFEYFTDFYRGQYSPVNTLVYGLIYHFFGIDPFYFHGFSLILHLINVMLVLLLVNQIQNIRKNTHLDIEEKAVYPTIAFITALLFLIHPMQVESVVWVSASKVLLYAFFFFMALFFYLKYIATSKKRFYLMSIILFIFSFGAKEQTVVFPLVLVLTDWFLDRDFKRKSVIMEKLPFFFLSICFSIVSILAQNSGFEYKLANEYYPIGTRLVLACYALSEYLLKLFVPLKLSAWYQFPMDPGEELPFKYYFYPILILFLLYYIYIFWKRNANYILFGILFFTINIILTLHIFPMARGVVMADRYIYVGSIGIFYIFSSYIITLYQKNKSEFRGKVILSAFFLYLISLGGYTFWYTDHWNIL